VEPVSSALLIPLGSSVPEWWTAEDLLQSTLHGGLDSFYLTHGPAGRATGLLSARRLLEIAPGDRRRWRLRQLAMPLGTLAVAGRREPVAAIARLLEHSPHHLGLLRDDADWRAVVVPEALADVFCLDAALAA
jgi:hypothetical protein